MLRGFRHFISATLVIVLFAGGVARFACTPGACAANAQCASMHCTCCGPNCPLRKSSGDSHKRDTACNQECPMMAASKLVAISNPQPIATAMLGADELQPLFLARVTPAAVPIHPTFNSPAPTLLSLGCALTT
jgi:hypothetical protein